MVIRNAAEYKQNDSPIAVAHNEFNNLCKLVREKHVQTDIHWTKNWKPARLIDYEKYLWHSYAFREFL